MTKSTPTPPRSAPARSRSPRKTATSLAVGTVVDAADTIVLLEDSDDMRGIFREMLEQGGHHVSEARDGPEGIECVLAERPDVALIDIGLPVVDGYEVARRVRAALGESILLVAMTGHGPKSDRMAALAAGFDTHLTKPIDISAIEAVLQPGEWWPRRAR